MAASDEVKRRSKKVVKQLKTDFPDVECALEFETPYQLLIATILSAQTTDERVNIVTRNLFAHYPDAASVAALPLAKLEKELNSVNFFRNKAKNVKACSEALVEQYDGEVPQDLDALVALAGVGRKTANVVLGTAFEIPSGVVVDTHVGRCSRRLGLIEETDAVKAEAELMKLLPKKEWIMYSHRLIYHGRQVCKARKPDCENCTMKKFCPQEGVG